MFNFRKPVSNPLQGKRIGVIGLGPRNGTTHIAISLSNYLSDSLKRRVCIIEQNQKNDFYKLKQYLNIPETASVEYNFHRVCYYPNIAGGESASRLTNSFDCTVFDLGHDFNLALRTLELCDLRIAVGTGAPWREDEYEILNKMFTGLDDLSSWILYINLGNQKQVKYYSKLGIAVYPFPLEPDPISPSEATNTIFERSLI